MLKLTVKNFGVLKDIDIELGKTNLFIGDNGSGKSTLAKLITVIMDFTLDEEKLIQKLKDFNIDFLNEGCSIELLGDELLTVKISSSNIYFSPTRKELNLNTKEYALQHSTINELINTLNLDAKLNTATETSIKEIEEILSLVQNYEEIDFHKIIASLKPKYIPAERNLISLFNQSLSNMISAEIPLPKTLLEFSASYNSARNEIKELDILGMKYKNENSQDRIYYEDGNFLALENSSSGIQSALPLYLTLTYFATKHRDIIIEEPESNLYPKSQIDTVKFMIENRGESCLSIMTHSPYILSILNVLIFAYKASSNNDVLEEKISAIIPQTQHINPDEFSAYLIEDGVSKSIKGESTGMIKENVIDDIGGMIDEQFAELMEIYREFKSDK